MRYLSLRPWRINGMALLLMMISSVCWARPSTRIVSQEEGDAIITLTLESQMIEGDSNVPCEVSVTILDDNREFTSGDTIDIFVREDDTFGDDTFWEIQEIVSPAIVAAGIFERTYDCRFPSMEDALGGLEVYAKLEVDKQECGRGCELTFGEDTPTTANIFMARRSDDPSEDDDTNREGTVVDQRLIADRISTDPDWFALSYAYPVELLARLETHLIGGDLTLTLYDQSLELIATATAEPDGESKSLRPPSALSAGTYFLEVTPTDAGDFNFYDLYVVESQVMGECITGDSESRPCGQCGREERVCNSGGEWGTWSACLGAGVCEPGAEESEGCGESGNRNRLCNSECQWGAFSECIQCEEGMTEACYTGPAELAGIGACIQGMRSCSRGQWSSCQGDILPRDERCDDNQDNDCNGDIDAADPACAGALGDACTSTSCSEDLECLALPGGYCGGSSCADCPAGSTCGEIAGREYCLQPCAGANDCRSGYLCAPAGLSGQSVCAPPCMGDQDCGVGQVCGSQRFCEEGETNLATIGQACIESDECASPWSCLTGLFPNGYCGGSGCGQCGSGGVCGQVRGQEFCLAPCLAAADCQSGYICAPANQTGDRACIPPCMSDAECSGGERCGSQGVCEMMIPVAGTCGAETSCSNGEVCGVDPTNQTERCLPACNSDDACGMGSVCGVEGFCVEAASAAVLKSPDEGCQQGAAPSTIYWLLFSFIALSMRKFRWRGEQG